MTEQQITDNRHALVESLPPQFTREQLAAATNTTTTLWALKEDRHAGPKCTARHGTHATTSPHGSTGSPPHRTAGDGMNTTQEALKELHRDIARMFDTLIAHVGDDTAAWHQAALLSMIDGRIVAILATTTSKEENRWDR